MSLCLLLSFFTKHLARRCTGRHGVLSVCIVSFLISVQFLRYMSKKNNNNTEKMKNCENELLHFDNFSII